VYLLQIMDAGDILKLHETASDFDHRSQGFASRPETWAGFSLSQQGVDDAGQVQGTGQEDKLAKEFADRLTAKYEELAKRDLVFSEIRNLMDLCVVAAAIAKEDLCGLAGCEAPVLTAPTSPCTSVIWTRRSSWPRSAAF
jgi:hypothetical protein